MRDPLSTEARIFVRQIAREVERRERNGAAAIAPGATQWGTAVEQLAARVTEAGISPVKRIALLQRAIASLNAIPMADRGHAIVNARLHSRTGMFVLIALQTGKHPLVGMEHEEGVTARRHIISVGRRCYSFLGSMELAHISNHALARLRERAANGVVELVLPAIAGLGLVGEIVRRSQKHQGGEINVLMGDVLVVGSLRYSHKTLSDGSVANGSFLDVRTVLPAGDHRPEQMIQSEAVAQALARLIDGECDLDALADAIPFVARRQDHVLDKVRGTPPGQP